MYTFVALNAGFRIRICMDPHLFELLDPDPHTKCDPDQDPGGQKCPTKIENSKQISCFEVLDVFF
jgi:hypothetical protein